MGTTFTSYWTSLFIVQIHTIHIGVSHLFREAIFKALCGVSEGVSHDQSNTPLAMTTREGESLPCSL